MAILGRLFNMLRGRRFERELDEELTFHLEMRADAHIQGGLNRDAAREAAQRQFGNLVRVREDTRASDVLDRLQTLFQDVRFGMRQLRRSPVTTLTCLLTLAMGLGANLALFSIFDAVLLKPLPYPHADRLVTVADRFPASTIGPTVPEFLDFLAGNQSFEAMAFFDNRDLSLSGGAEPERVYVSRVSGDFFQVLGIKPALGSLLATQANHADSGVVVLSNRFWLDKFGADQQIVGKKIRLNDAPAIVIGVLPAQAGLDFAALGVSEPVDLYSPFPMNDPGYSSRALGSANSRRVHVLAKLKSATTVAAAGANMSAIAVNLTKAFPQLYRASNGGTVSFTVDVNPLQDDIVRNSRSSLRLLLGAVTLIFLLACVNSGHARLAQAISRQREFAIRGALGASRPRLIRQVLIENCLLSLMAIALAALFAGAILRVIPAQLAAANPVQGAISFDGRVFVFASTLLFGTITLVGLAPALSSSGVGARLALRSKASADDRGHVRLRGLFIIAEIAFAFVLVIGAGLLLRSLMALQAQATGFSADNVLTMQMRLPYAVERTFTNPSEAYQRELAALTQIPGVESAAFATSLPLRGFAASLSLPSQSQDDAAATRQNVQSQIVSPGYFSALHVPLIAGRVFTDDDDPLHPQVLIVNRAAATRFSDAGNPIGTTIRVNSVSRVICGIVGDVRLSPAEASPVPQIYLPYLQSYEPNVTLIVRARGDANRIFPDVRQALLSVYPNQAVFHVIAMDSILYDSVAGPRLMASLIGTLAFLSLAMAAFGLYGTIAYLVARRIPEIAVRLALGASSRNIFALIAGRVMAFTLIGLTVGVAASLSVGELLARFLYGVRATDMLTFASTCLLFLLVASIAAMAPLRNALSTHPANALRSE
jgi:putative ABC transport system permease protein